MKFSLCRFGFMILIATSGMYSGTLQANSNDSKALLVDELLRVWLAPKEGAPNKQLLDKLQKMHLSRLKLDLIPRDYEHLVNEYKSELIKLLSKTQIKGIKSAAVKQYYADYYSESELLALISFYQSELGQKHLLAQPPIGMSEEFKQEMHQQQDDISQLTENFLFQLRQSGFDADFIKASGMTPMKAIQYSEMFTHSGYDGTFEFEINAANIHNNHLYINSESDYRDRRCLTVRIVPELVKEFIDKYGENVAEAIVGMSLMVKGTAKRVVIKAIGPDGQPTFPYYQTHIVVNDLSQLIISKATDRN